MYKEDHAAQVNSKLSHHSQDGVHVENVGQGTLLGQGCQGLGPKNGQWHEIV